MGKDLPCDQAADDLTGDVHVKLAHVQNEMVEPGIVVVLPAEFPVQVRTPFVLEVDGLPGAVRRHLVVLLHEPHPVLSGGHQKDVEGVRFIAKDVLAAPADDDRIAFCRDLPDNLLKEVDVDLLVDVSALLFDLAIVFSSVN
jgi:hypothetical protein